MAKMTQRRKSVLDWQIANRRANSYMLDLAYNLMQPNLPDLVPTGDDVLIHGISHTSWFHLFPTRGRIYDN
jgi:hypothetical protein